MADKSKNIKRIMVLSLVLAGLVALYISGIWRPRETRVTVKRDTIIKSNYNFIYEHWKENRLFELARNEDFTSLEAGDQFGFFLKLCDWVHRQWESSVPDPYPLCNAVDILRDIRSKKTGGFCGQYAYVLADVLKTMGYFAVRYAELWSDKGESHFVVEVWSDSYEKWLVLDADHNLYYEAAETGIPANAYEIRRSLFEGKKIVARSAETPHRDLGGKKIELYANFAVSLRSDLMRHPRPLTVQDRFQMFLFFRDHRTNERFFGPQIPYQHVTTRIADLYYDCNCARVEYRVGGQDNRESVTLEFFTDGSMPNFRAFALSRDRGKTWDLIPGHAYHIGDARETIDLLVAPVNMYNRRGCINHVKIEF